MRTWWQRLTLRSKLALWYAVGGALLLTGFSATIYGFVTAVIARPLDAQLRRDLVAVSQRLQVQPGGRVLWDGHEVPTATEWGNDYPWFELWDEHGQLVRRFWPFAETRVALTPI